MISIITVVRNAEQTIENSILSVLSQTYKDYEFIIIDGNSTDNTANIINKYLSRISIFVSEPDLGIYDAMNKAIIKSNGDWIYFLGSDDVFYNNGVLENIFSNKLYKSYDILYGNVLTKNGKELFDGEFDVLKHFSKSVCQQAIFYRKSVFSKGLFENKYLTTADYVFNIKHLSKNYDKWLYIPNIICIYNESGSSYKLKDLEYFRNNFILRFNAFNELLPAKDLSRLIYPSYFNYFKSHSLKLSIINLLLFIKKVGFSRILITIIQGIYRKHGSN
jgi:glycosyltransferase involved in cell wall biosynthesis